MNKNNVILFITTFVFTFIVSFFIFYNMGGVDAETSKNPDNYWSTENAPIIYGASKISIPVGESFDIKDARFRVFARDFEDGELTRSLQIKSNNVDTSVAGNYEIHYSVIDSHGNKSDLVQEVIVEEGRTTINIERIVYTLPSADHLHKIGVYRADYQDRQILGIYLAKDATAQIRSIDADMDMNVQYYSNDSWREGSTTKIPKSGDWVTLKNEYKKIDPSTRTAYNPVIWESANSVPLLQTVMLNDANNSLTKTFKIELQYNLIDNDNRKNTGEVRRLKYYYYKDDYDAFLADWNVPASDYNKTVNQVATDLSSYDDSVIYDQFAVVDSYRYMVVADSWSYNKLINYDTNWFDTLEHHLEYYNKLVNRYDEIFGLSKNPENLYDQNVESKNVAKPNAHGAGGAYYGTNHIGINFPSNYTIFERNWGGLHETGHGYQGPFGNGSQMNLGETSNNVFAVYVQRDKTIYQANNTWLGEMTDREVEANEFRLTTGGWPSSDHLNWRLYILMNLFDSLEGADTYGKMYSWYRNKVINEGYTRENHDAYVESLADIYHINIIPYMEAWGITITDSVKADIYSRNLKIYNILGDILHGDELTEYMTQHNIELKYTLIDTSSLKQTGKKNDLTINIDIDDISKVNGKRIILKDNSTVVKNVEITSSSVLLTDVPIGTYQIQMPIVDGYSGPLTYAEITNEANVMSYTYTKNADIDYTDYLSINVIGSTSNNSGYTIKFSDHYKKGTITLGLANMGNDSYYVKIYDNNGTLLEDDRTDYKHTDNKWYFHFDSVNGKALTKEITLDTGYVIEVSRTDYINKVWVLDSSNKKVPEYNMTAVTTRYVLMDNGIRLESMTEEEGINTAYEILKTKLINTIESFMDSATVSDIEDKYIYTDVKADVVSAYNNLRAEDQLPYTEFIKRVLKGGSPKLKYIGETTYDKSKTVDLYSLVSAVDAEDGDMVLTSRNTTITSEFDITKNGVYTVSYKVIDSDGNYTTLDVDITVNNPEELIKEEKEKVITQQVIISPRTEETNTTNTSINTSTETSIVKDENTTINEEITTNTIEKKSEEIEEKKTIKKSSKFLRVFIISLLIALFICFILFIIKRRIKYLK